MKRTDPGYLVAKFLIISVLFVLGVGVLGPSPVQAQDAPTIITQPSDVSVAIGDRATLKVEASSSAGPLWYQWQWYSTDQLGMTNATLTLDSAQLCQAGFYTVVVSNEVGNVVSRPAVVSVVGIASWGYAPEESGYVPTGRVDAVSVGVARTYTAVLRANGTLQAVGANDQGELNVPAGLTNVVAVSVGEHHGVALTATGNVVQWGSKLSQQGSVPANLSNVVAVSAGAFHSLGLKSDNTVVAWGRNAYGEALVPQDLTDVVAISAGYTHSMALKANGTVICWGDRSYVPPDLQRVVAIAAGESHDLALKSDGTVVAWGNNYNGQTSVPYGLSNVIAIAAGGYQSLALKGDGMVTGWGLVDDMWHSHMPACLNNVVAVAAAAQHNAALVGSGAPFITKQPVSHSAGAGTFSAFRVEATGATPLTYQWRLNGVDLPGENRDTLLFETVRPEQAGAYSVVVHNRYGQQTSADTQLSVSGIAIVSHPQNQFTYLSGGAQMSVGVAGEPPFSYQWLFEGEDIPGAVESVLSLSDVDWSRDGVYEVAVSNRFGSVMSYPARLSVRSIAGWGNAFSGRNNIPARLTNVVAIAEGGDHMLALLSDGTVRAWGQNFYGQLDIPAGLTHVVAIAAGDVHSVALKDDGTVVTWGFNDSPNIKAPADLNGVVAIAAAWANVIALKADGTVVAWGVNFEGLTDVPPGLRNVVAISVAQHYCVALRADGSVVGWGNSWAPLFAPPNDLKEVVAVAAGGTCCMALKKDGSVVIWGPDPTGIRLTTPADLSDVVGIAAGDNHLLAVKNTGAVRAWGAGDDGQTSVPLDLPAASMVSAGRAHSSALIGSELPWLVTPPMSCSGGIGTSVGLRVVATGVWPLSYQWRLNGLELPAATNSVLWISDLKRTNAGAYSVSVTNRYGSAVSPEAMVSVDGVSVTIQPVPQVRYQGGETSFKVGATGQPPIQFQWIFEGVEIPDATNSVLTLTNIQPAQAGHYMAHVMNPFGSVDSSEATLTVLPVLIKAQPVSQQVLAGGSVSFDVSVEGIGPFTYQWQFNGVDIPGMTNSTLQLVNVLPGEAGAYSVLVSNAFGSIASSLGQCYVLTLAGWGGNSYGQITIPLGLTNVVAIAGGGDYTLALKADGTVTAWGDFRFGQTNAPKGLNSVIAIARGGLHNLGLRSDGSVIGWGDNSYGQTNIPASAVQATAISAGANHSLALSAGGAVSAWGDDRLGQTQVPSGLGNVVAIAAIANYNLALRADGTVAAWGDNSFGQTDVPAGLTNVLAIAGEARHALALKLDGTVVSWGEAPQDGGAVPTGLTNVVAIAGGDAHDVTLLANGSVVSWGDDSHGQVDVPTGLTNVMAVAAGREHTIVLLSDGSPKVTVQPWDRTVTDNADLVIAAKAVGVPPLQYQWQLNGVDIPGATQEAYPILNAQTSSAGNYTLVVSNKLGVASTRKNKVLVLPAQPTAPRFVPGSAVRREDGTFQVRIEAALACTVSFEESNDLVHWVKFGSETNHNGRILLTVPPSGAARRFYRLKSAE